MEIYPVSFTLQTERPTKSTSWISSSSRLESFIWWTADTWILQGFTRFINAKHSLWPGPKAIPNFNADIRNQWTERRPISSAIKLGFCLCILQKKRLSRHHRASQSQRRQRQKTQLLDKQYNTQARAHCGAVPPKIACCLVFQMDQATFTNQEISGYHRERIQNTNLDCSVHLRAQRDRK